MNRYWLPLLAEISIKTATPFNSISSQPKLTGLTGHEFNRITFTNLPTYLPDITLLCRHHVTNTEGNADRNKSDYVTISSHLPPSSASPTALHAWHIVLYRAGIPPGIL